VRCRLDTVMALMSQGIAVSPPDLLTIAAQLVAVRYYRRFLDEARILGEEVGEKTEGSDAHAG